METAQPEPTVLPMRNGEFKQRLDSYERSLIELALRDAGGNQRRAAAALGILPTTLCEKMKRLGIPSRSREWIHTVGQPAAQPELEPQPNL